MNSVLRKKALTAYLVPLMPVGIALLVVSGFHFLSFAALGLGIFLAYRQAGRVARGLLPPPVYPTDCGPRTRRDEHPIVVDAGSPDVSASTVSYAGGDLENRLTREAARRNGALTVAQGVLASGASSREVMAALENLETHGYVTSERGPDGTWSVYRFHELEPVAA